MAQEEQQKQKQNTNQNAAFLMQEDFEVISPSAAQDIPVQQSKKKSGKS